MAAAALAGVLVLGVHGIERWEEAETLTGLIVNRFDAPVFFVNSEHLHQRVLALVEKCFPRGRIIREPVKREQ